MFLSDATHIFLLKLPIALLDKISGRKILNILCFTCNDLQHIKLCYCLKFQNYSIHRKMTRSILRALCLYKYFYQLNILTRILIFYKYSIIIHEITPSNVSTRNLCTPTTADEELGLPRHFDRFRHNHFHYEKILHWKVC